MFYGFFYLVADDNIIFTRSAISQFSIIPFFLLTPLLNYHGHFRAARWAISLVAVAMLTALIVSGQGNYLNAHFFFLGFSGIIFTTFPFSQWRDIVFLFLLNVIMFIAYDLNVVPPSIEVTAISPAMVSLLQTSNILFSTCLLAGFVWLSETANSKNDILLEALSSTDSLTGMSNRRGFEPYIERGIHRCQRSGFYGAVLFIDLDHFKDINDSLGHALGDELLQQFSQRLQQRLRRHEILARLGGDEFVVLLEELDHDKSKSQVMAAQVARMLQALIQEPFLLEDNPYTLTCSVGITLFNNASSNKDEILRQADLALYKSKHRGRNCYSFFEQEMSDHALRHITLLNNVREAINRNEFSLAFQPKVDMQTNELKGAETLLRWNHGDLGFVSPAEFIPILESSTLILEVGRWVLEHSFRQLKQWQSAGLWDDEMRLAINISPRQLLDRDFVASVTELLGEQGLSPSMFEFEITENVLVQDVEKVRGILGNLASMGISFSIDDFGTGYSSLSYLKQLPIDVLKIDKSFIDHCTKEGNDQAIVRSILSICTELGLTSVAEGVETKEQQKQLQLMGCDLLQGYLFSRPITADEFSTMLASSK
jgi:diguanylate cyclase (GGDEF)-like protein